MVFRRFVNVVCLFFQTLVANYPFDDHNAPPFQLMKPYCEDMEEFLSQEGNVAIVHCKAGKVCACFFRLTQCSI